MSLTNDGGEGNTIGNGADRWRKKIFSGDKISWVPEESGRRHILEMQQRKLDDFMNN